jgi:hypothetical protein
VNYIRTEDERYDHPLIPVPTGFVTFPAHDQHPAIPVGTPVRHAGEQVTVGPTSVVVLKNPRPAPPLP